MRFATPLVSVTALAFFGLSSAAVVAPRACDLANCITALAPLVSTCYQAIEDTFESLSLDIECLEDAINDGIALPAGCNGCL